MSRRGGGPTIQVNIDATQMSQAFIGASYIQNIVTAEIDEFVRRRQAGAAAPASVVVRVMFNPNLNGVWFGGVMEIINNITMLSVILTGAALIREREHGTLEHLLVMPLSPFQIMAAKVWANGLVVLLAAGLSLWLVVRGALGVPIAGSVLLFLGGAALHLFSTTSLGIFLGTVARSMPQFGLLMILVILPLQMLSGGMTPRESMPAFVQAVMTGRARPRTSSSSRRRSSTAAPDSRWSDRDLLRHRRHRRRVLRGVAPAVPPLGGPDPRVRRTRGPSDPVLR